MNHQDVAHVGGDTVGQKDVSGLMQHVRTRTMSGPDDVWARARDVERPGRCEDDST